VGVAVAAGAGARIGARAGAGVAALADAGVLASIGRARTRVTAASAAARRERGEHRRRDHAAPTDACRTACTEHPDSTELQGRRHATPSGQSAGWTADLNENWAGNPAGELDRKDGPARGIRSQLLQASSSSSASCFDAGGA